MASKLRTLQTGDFGFSVVLTGVVGLPEMKSNEMMGVTEGHQGPVDFVLLLHDQRSRM